MWGGWVIGYVLSVGRRWLSEAVTPILSLVRLKDEKDKMGQWKDRDKRKYRFSRLRRLLLMRMDLMKLQRNLFEELVGEATELSHLVRSLFIHFSPHILPLYLFEYSSPYSAWKHANK
jgi:hypothetical protein